MLSGITTAFDPNLPFDKRVGAARSRLSVRRAPEEGRRTDKSDLPASSGRSD